MLNYQVYCNNSNSPWVIFLHGIGGSIATWKKQIDAFKNYNILLLDLPGHGKSETETDITVKSVNDSIKEVMDHLHISKADFVSLSLGTLVALHFAIKYPNRVKTIVLGGSILNIEGFYKFLMKLTCAVKRMIPYRLLFKILAKILLPKKNHELSRKIFIRESQKLNRKTFLLWLN
jgi:pimeloyl-ACP methyl ester carboxylesterase